MATNARHIIKSCSTCSLVFQGASARHWVMDGPVYHILSVSISVFTFIFQRVSLSQLTLLERVLNGI